MNDSNGSPLIQPRTATVDIYLGDYLDRIRHLERRFEAALESEKAAGPRLESDVPESHTIAAEHAALQEEAEAGGHVLHVKVQALGRRAWKALCAEHPPRQAGDSGATDEQVKSDAAVGVNETTFKDALVAVSVVEPALSGDDFDAMADIDFDRLYLTAFALNRTPAAAGPKASLASRLTQTSEETSS